jgi:signal transduction histidine kinase/ActR/RegA family two-component response regulator
MDAKTRNRSDTKMHFNRVTLAFTGAHEHIEADFKHHYFHSTLNQIRIATLAALIFYGGFGVLDAILMPDRYHMFWFIRWAIVCPIILMVFLFSYTRWASRFLQPVLGLGTLICGLGIIAIIQLATPHSNHSYVGGLVQIIFYVFTFSRLRFVWGATVVCVLVPAYMIVTTAVGGYPQNYIIGKAFHLSVIGVMGMMAGYAIEYQTRKNFFLSRQLETKKRRLAMAKVFLEERVARRTAELKKTNAILEEDIAHRKKTEKALADSQMRFKTVFETAAAGMAIIEDRTRTVVEINRAGAQMTRYKRDQLTGRCIDELIALSEEDECREMPVPTPHPIECVLTTAESKDLPILISTQNTVLNDQPHWIISFVNLQKIKEAETAQRELQLRSSRAQHLESIGTLAGGIAHDFNNILFGIMGFAELALEDAEHNSTQANNLQEILKGGYRARDMIAQILTFSRQDSMEKAVIHPAPLIKEALKLLRASLPSTIEIHSRYAAELGNVKVNPTHLHQVIMNLCTNASHALPNESGTIDITMDNHTLKSDRQTSHDTILKGDYVRLRVKDNGVGIASDAIDRIFEPFYTTKPIGQGSGMGLSVVLGIVQSNHGFITVESRPDEGTCFEVLLPQAESEDERCDIVETALPRGREQILVVDDEPPLLRLLNRMLTSLGYQVTTCEHPAEALALFNSHPRLFDLVLTDLTMPKKSGTALAQELLQNRPNLPIILSTGYGDKISKEALESYGIRELLLKPILKKELASAIRHVLDTA